MKRHIFGRVGSMTLILALFGSTSIQGQAVRPAAVNYIPARFDAKADALGFQWQIGSRGYLQRATNSCIEVAGHLQVGSSEFYPQQQLMTPDGTQYVLKGTRSGVEVTRRVKFDLKAGTVRFVDSFRNPGTAPVSIDVKITTALRNQPVGFLTDRGESLAGVPTSTSPSNPFGRASGSFTSALGQKDSGLVLTQSQPGMPSVLLYLAAARAKTKPAFQSQSNNRLTVSYPIAAIPPQQTVSIVHGIAQRNLGSKTDARSLRKSFGPFTARGWTRDLPDDVRDSLINYRRSQLGDEAPGGPLLRAVVELADHYGLERGSSDLLVQDESTHLAGTVSGGELAVATRFGPVTVALADVAMLLGGAGVGRPMRVHLRNGEILAGPVEAKGLVLTTKGGLEIGLVLGRINALLMRADPRDGKPPPGATALLSTRSGDRVAVVVPPAARLQTATAWGLFDVPLADVAVLAQVREPQPIHRLTLADKSRLSVILRGDDLALESPRFGPIKLLPGSIDRWVTAHLPTVAEEDSEEDDGRPAAAHCVLAGENLLVGTLAGPTLQVVTAAGPTPLEIAQIREMEQTDDEASGTTFAFELADGSELTGRVEQRVLAIVARGKTWSVPTGHLLALRQPGLKEASHAEPADQPGPASKPALRPGEKPEPKPVPAPRPAPEEKPVPSSDPFSAPTPTLNPFR